MKETEKMKDINDSELQTIRGDLRIYNKMKMAMKTKDSKMGRQRMQCH